MQNYLKNFPSMVIFAAIEHFCREKHIFVQEIEVKNSNFWHSDHLLERASGFFEKPDLISENPFDPLSHKPSIIENDQEIKKFSLYCLIRSILTKFATFEGAWLRPQKGRSLKCIFFGISIQNSIALYGLFLDSRDFFQMRTVVRVLYRMPLNFRF